MAKRSKTTVHVLKVDSTDLPDKLDEFIAVFQKAWEETPEEYRKDLVFHKWGQAYYDSPYVEFEAYYQRDETDEEMANRIQKQDAAASERARKELDLLASLQAKYSK